MTAATRTALTTASTILTAVVLATTFLPARESLRLDVYTADASSLKQKYAGVALEGILVRGAQAAFQK